jgi:hypothetical protein
MKTRKEREEEIESLQEAQTTLHEAIEQLEERLLEIVGRRRLEAIERTWLGDLKIQAGMDHGFLTNDRGLGELIEDLQDELEDDEREEDEDEDEDEEELAERAVAAEEARIENAHWLGGGK